MTEPEPPECPSKIYGRRRNLVLSIIKQNVLSQLHQYIASYPPEAVLAPTGVYSEDPFFVAATHGSPETLRVLLDVYAAVPEVVERFDQRRLCLLHDVCAVANLDTVRFILNSHNSQRRQLPLPLGTVDLHGRNDAGKTPTLAAAASLVYLNLDADEAEEDEGANRNTWIGDRIARGQQLIHFLLDQGCPATDIIHPFLNDTAADNRQPRGSVLGLAVSRAGGRLVQRLIDLGVNVYLKHQHFHDTVASLQFRNEKALAHDTTTLHLASLFWNADVVNLLLDHHHDQNKSKNNPGPDLVSSRDTNGRLPLHWAAASPGTAECRLTDEKISFRIKETFRLLLEHGPMGINLRDDARSTPLQPTPPAEPASTPSSLYAHYSSMAPAPVFRVAVSGPSYMY